MSLEQRGNLGYGSISSLAGPLLTDVWRPILYLQAAGYIPTSLFPMWGLSSSPHVHGPHAGTHWSSEPLVGRILPALVLRTWDCHIALWLCPMARVALEGDFPDGSYLISWAPWEAESFLWWQKRKRDLKQNKDSVCPGGAGHSRRNVDETRGAEMSL